MLSKIVVAAVGDLLMKSEIIASAKRAGKYDFDPIFNKVNPYLKKHDLTIANLETTFSGRRKLGLYKGPDPKCNCPRERRHPRTGFPVFNCPDDLASALKRNGFQVLITSNNHSMDGGVEGVKRTLQKLDQFGLKHTGTNRSREEASKPLIIRAKDITIGILGYTQGTNSLPVPTPWLVNRMEFMKVLADVRRLRNKVDFLIVYLHFGREYQSLPSKEQKKWVQLLFRNGVNVVLGAHPHVLHPVQQYKMKDKDGRMRTRIAATSLGNFVSTKLRGDSNTMRGMIFSFTITKNHEGITDISGTARLPTMVQVSKEKGRKVYTIVPIKR
ncbi:poly-gamma-glutamate synthesis protein (capsule biosynthesis protein) [Paenibacillus phyllosphaerae]|uniref:Poly-gamma-glutamate synthesis protein (Capsule biosynthesis protein) n=1 Tax=Paenibacillus phyllosphaerae TaxID=274593 RepID=A0A7W5FLV8_9BACL|nr:CapA family protein [Paenibacillus phyllosphaerae]MBB3109586.1 poly-gamma-glutamate synthesis protein (capsule biosynthesis protein) [Paenibacillus phyllosphaerae]